MNQLSDKLSGWVMEHQRHIDVSEESVENVATAVLIVLINRT